MRGRGRAVVEANCNAVDAACSLHYEAVVQTDELPMGLPIDHAQRTQRKDVAIQAICGSNAACQGSLNLLDEIIQILEKDVEESREMCSDLHQCKLEEIEVSDVCGEGKANAAVLPYENKFWIGCGTDNLKVFKNPKDRRIESIACTSGCRITLRENKRKNALGEWQQLVVVEAASEVGLRKCTNLLDEKFPAFRAGSGRTNCGECSCGRLYLVPNFHLHVPGLFPAAKPRAIVTTGGLNQARVSGALCAFTSERRTALVARELARCKVDIAALSETRFSEQGQLEEVGARCTFFCSDRPTAE
ncbi:unnamed protein product [Schistocephalus solidus]|uniref:Tick transposon n=1 Tax=Schistocephalus solidus TaxID=70667 RepID=A0A183TB85_SCHSO|nr:unnamed protein product [Schistocephalus solidus]